MCLRLTSITGYLFDEAELLPFRWADTIPVIMTSEGLEELGMYSELEEYI
jgi:hypothetical protein